MAPVSLLARARPNSVALIIRETGLASSLTEILLDFLSAISSERSFHAFSSKLIKARPTVYFCKKNCIPNIPEKKLNEQCIFKFNSGYNRVRDGLIHQLGLNRWVFYGVNPLD